MHLLRQLSRLRKATEKVLLGRPTGTVASNPSPQPGNAGDHQAQTVRCTGSLVQDVDVGPRYPGFVARDYAAVGGEAKPSERRSLVCFRVPEAIVTKAYIIIDPAHRELFINQTDPNITTMLPATAPLFTPDGFTFASERVHRLPGRTAVIGGQIAGNYYHWVINWCPRLILLRDLAPEIYNDPDVKFLIDISAQQEPFASFLRALAIPPDRIIWANCMETDYQLEEAVVVSLPTQHVFFPELQAALAEAVQVGIQLPSPKGRKRRIWVSRQELPAPRRRVANMEAVTPVLERFGFEDLVLERMSLAEQISAFAEAEIILGVHGAGFVNMIFCSKDCRILAIEKEFALAHNLDHFVTSLAQSCGLSHAIMVAEPHIIDGVERDFWQRHAEDVEINPKALADFIEGFGITP